MLHMRVYLSIKNMKSTVSCNTRFILDSNVWLNVEAGTRNEILIGRNGIEYSVFKESPLKGVWAACLMSPHHSKLKGIALQSVG